MGNTIGHSGVSEHSDTKPCNIPSAFLPRCRGVTLIELAFVIGIIAVIVVAALAVYNAVRSSQDLTTAVADVSAIRTAVSNWAGNEPVFRDPPGQTTSNTPSTKLENLAQISRLLPGKLRQRASTGLELGGVNPWQGSYRVLDASESGLQDQTGQTYDDNYFAFAIEITGIPITQHEPLHRRLKEGAEAISATEGAGVTEGDVANLMVVYRI